MIIDTDANLLPNFKRTIYMTGITKYSTDYHIVSIIGAQSSGKSTLLNRVFGTNFQTMDRSLGRQQTTKGINCAMAVSSPIFLIDPEGSDSRERGDADALFERKSALFAIALSEVLIINMWETDVGRFNAANIPLLQAAFEANIQLFSKYKETVTSIVFIIRDLSTKFKKPLFEQLLSDMEYIWSEIKLPDDLKKSKVTDFFTFHFETTRHMIIDPEGFQEDVNRIREKFTNNLFIPKGSTKIVPGKSLSDYIENIWTIINTNKELNIPSQRLLISKIRCSEVAKLVFDKFKQRIEKKKKEGKVSKRYKDSCLKHGFEAYSKLTWKYIDTCVKESEKTMNEMILSYLDPMLRKEAEEICSKHLKEFIEKTKINQESIIDKNTHWNHLAHKRIRHRISCCEKEINETVIPSHLKWTFDLHDFKEKINEIIEESRETVKLDAIDFYTEKLMENFEEQSNLLFKSPENGMWDKADALIEKFTRNLQSEIRDIFNANGFTVPLITNRIFVESCEEIARANSRFIVLKMKSAFDSFFMYDQTTKLPRVWKYKDNINSIFEESRKKGLSVLDIFSNMTIQKRTIQLLSKETIELCQEKYRNIIIHEYEQARDLLLSSSSNTKIPSWCYFVILVLGYDWIWWGLTNPFVFLFLFIFGILFFLKKNNILSPIVSLISRSLTQKQPEKPVQKPIDMKSFIIEDKIMNQRKPKQRRRKRKVQQNNENNLSYDSQISENIIQTETQSNDNESINSFIASIDSS